MLDKPLWLFAKVRSSDNPLVHARSGPLRCAFVVTLPAGRGSVFLYVCRAPDESTVESYSNACPGMVTRLSPDGRILATCCPADQITPQILNAVYYRM